MHEPSYRISMQPPMRLGSEPLAVRGPVSTVVAVVLGTFFYVLCVGCASYTRRTERAMRDFQNGQLEAALEAFADEDEIGSPFLSGAEAGMVAWTAGDWERTIELMHKASDAVEDIEGRALVGPERLAETLGSWALNDTARAYQGEGFERVYLHGILATAYLATGRVDDVYVEVRRANKLLEAEEKLYDKEYEAGGLGHFVSALTYELIGKPDDAWIDYKRMLDKGVGTELAGRALLRLAHTMGRQGEIPDLEERFGPDPGRPHDVASIVVLAGVGLAPFKYETSVPVPTRDGFIPFAVPGYKDRTQVVDGLQLSARETGAQLRTALIERVTKVARENLSDRIAWMAAKSVARGIAKRELTKQLEQSAGLGGRILGDVFAVVSERADLRCWQTLPDSWQACRLFVPSGRHTLSLAALGGESRELGCFQLEPGETMLVFARTVGGRLYAHPIGGTRLGNLAPMTDAEAAASAPAEPR